MERRILTGGILFILFLLIPSQTEAQFLKKLKKKAEQKVMDKIERKIDEKLEAVANKAVDKSWNSIFGEEGPSGSVSEEDGGSSGKSSRMKLPFKTTSNVKTEDVYRFNKETVMEIRNSNSSSDEPQIIRMFEGDDEYSGTLFYTPEAKGEETFIVYDYKNEAMVMLMDSEEGTFSFAYEWENTMSTMDEESNENGSAQSALKDFDIIGNKTIEGIKCTGYRNNANGVTTEFWVADENDESLKNMMNANASTKYLRGFPMFGVVGHPILEMKQVDHESGDEIEMKITEINKRSNKSYTMSDYPTIGFN